MRKNCLRKTYTPAVNTSSYTLPTTAHYLAEDLCVGDGKCDQTERSELNKPDITSNEEFLSAVCSTRCGCVRMDK
jgi:hypothetical protein